MGRLLVLVALLGVMLALRSLRLESTHAHDPLILAAIGFVVLASYTAAAVGSEFKLPRVSGYLAAGVLLGPSVFDVLSSRVVEEMTMFNTLALGLIATGAGLELELKALSTSWKTLGVTVLAKILLSGGPVFAAFYLVQTLWSPLLLSSSSEVIAVALVLGTVSVGTSPAIVLAVINEMGARNRVAELALGAAVIKDFVLVVLLAITLAVATHLIGTSAAQHGIGLQVAKELLGSIVAGALVGLLMILYVRFVAAEMLLFVAALVLAVAEVSRILHLDLLLVFIMSGFFVRNFSRVWRDVLHALETVALPVFVVFFTIAGARIDIHNTYRLLPCALLLSALRALGFYGAARLGGALGGEPAATSKRAFLAYLPQAGVTLGLLGLAAKALPSLSEELMAVGVATVAINLAVGPVTLRRALQPSGEKSESEPSPAVPEADPGAASLPPTPRPATELSFGGEALRRAALDLERDLLSLVERTVREHMVTHTQALAVQLSEVFSADEAQRALPKLHAFSREERGKALVERASRAARDFCTQCERLLAQLSAEVVVPCAPELILGLPRDSWRIRLRKLRARLVARFRRRAPERRVPLRLAARYALSPRLARLAGHFLASMGRTHGRILIELRRRASLSLSAAELADAVGAHLQAMLRDFRSDASLTLAHGMAELAEIARGIDSPVRPLSALRYSKVEPEVRQAVDALEEAPAHFERALSAGEAAVELAAALSRVSRAAEAALSREVLVPLSDAAEELAPAVAAARSHLTEILTALSDEQAADRETLSAHLSRLSALRENREREAPGDSGTFRAAASLHAVNVELRQLVDSLPELLRVPAMRDGLGAIADPADFSVHSLSLRAEARRTLILELMPTVDLEGTRAAESVQDLDLRRAEAVEMAESALEAALSTELGWDELRDAIQRALGQLSQSEQETRTQLRSAGERVAEQLAAAVGELSDLTTQGGREPLSFVKAPIAPLNRLRDVVRAARRRLTTAFGRLRAFRDQLRGAALTRHLTAELTNVHELAALIRPRDEVLPGVYGRLFRLDPLRDLRLSAAREDERSRLLAAERAWQQGGPGSALIVGDPGSGCTTLLNLAQAEFRTHRLIRPEPVVAPRDIGLMRALAYELRCKPVRKEVLAALTSDRTVVVLDDLGQWFATGPAALAGLREFLDLVSRTQREVFWVVSASRPWLNLITDAVAVPVVFGQLIELAPLSASAIRRLIEARHALSGMTLVHSEGFFSRALGRVREGFSADLEFRLLHSVCGGNVQAALAAWGRAVEVQGGAVRVNAHRFLLEQLPPLSGLDAPVLALLAHLVRFGPLDLRRIADGLGLSRQETQRYLQLLDNSGLLVRVGRQRVGLDPQHRWRLMPWLPLQPERRAR